MEKFLKDYKDFLTPGAILIASIIIAISNVYAGGGLRFDGTTGSNANEVKAPIPVILSITADDHIRGNPDAKVTIVEFSDMQCPFCSAFHPTLMQAIKEYGDKIRWVFLHFPIDSLHQNARPAAEASECAWEQGGGDAFWTFADMVFQNQSAMGTAMYHSLASQMKLNLLQFDACVSSRKYKGKVESDYQQGLKTGVTGTPTIYINGIQPFSGAHSYEELKAAIEQAL